MYKRQGMHIYAHTHKHSVVTIPCSSLVELMCMCYYFSEGSNLTPAHHCSDFRFKTYAPVAFRYFRDLFGIQPEDFMVSPASLSPALCCIFLIPHLSSFTIQPIVACAQCCWHFPVPAILSDHSCFTWKMSVCVMIGVGVWSFSQTNVWLAAGAWPRL